MNQISIFELINKEPEPQEIPQPAQGVKPKFNRDYKSEYTCGNCGHRVIVQDNFCTGCGFMIKWDSTRCLTGLPLVDAAERR